MNDSRKTMVFVIALLCAITLLACDINIGILPPSGGGGQQQPAGKPDLIVTDAHFEPDPVVQGQQFRAEFQVKNQGTADAGPFTVVWHFPSATGLQDCKWERDKLGAGGQFSGNCTRTTNAQPGTSPTRLTVDTENKVAESKEDNNEATPTLTVSAFAVTSVTATVVPPATFTGSCPHTFKLSGVITANGPGTVTWKWELHGTYGLSFVFETDTSSATGSTTFSGHGSKTVTADGLARSALFHSEGVTFDSPASGWVRLHVLTPNDMTSTQAEFNLACPFP